MSNFEVTNLKVNYRKNPLGIDDLHPRLSWWISTEIRGFIQSAYQVQVANDHKFFSKIIWDSEKLESDSNVHIEYEGPALQSRTRYYFRVRAWDDHGIVSEWSEPAHWETALLSVDEWQAKWIAASPNHQENGADPCDYIRTEFSIPDNVVSARVYATSLGMYRLYINGKPADNTLFNPGWTSYNKRLQYQTYDVTSLIAAGNNALGCMVGNGWYKGYLAWEGK